MLQGKSAEEPLRDNDSMLARAYQPIIRSYFGIAAI
jgi:hypothetical protein